MSGSTTFFQTDVEKNLHSLPSRRTRIAILITTIALIVLSTFVVLSFAIFTIILPTSVSTGSIPHVTAPNPVLLSRVARLATTPMLKLSPSQELAVITSFVVAHASNSLSSSINPSLPIDPQLVLDFDIRRPGASKEIAAVEQDTWTEHPVVLYGKHYSPITRLIKFTLSSIEMSCRPTFIDIDIREDAWILGPIITRLTGASELPVLLIGGLPVSFGDSRTLPEHIDSLKASGELERMMTDAGVVVVGDHKPVRKLVQADPRQISQKLKKKDLRPEGLLFRGLVSV